MTKIIFQRHSRNYVVPGLPYQEHCHYVHPILLDNVPTVKELEMLIQEWGSDTFTNPLSIAVAQGFRDYIPTTFRRITQEMPSELVEKYFGAGGTSAPEELRILLQLQTEIEAKGATIDAAIVHQRRDLGTVVNKAHLLNRIYHIGRIYGHLQERDPPFLFGNLKDESTWDDALSSMKKQFMEYMMEVPQGKRRHGKTIRREEVSQRELDEKYVYVEWLKEKLGENLVGVLLYGSAARTDDPSQYSDFDNWVRVRDVTEAHKVLTGTCPSVIDGKVVEMRCKEDQEPKGAKHLGIHLFPESEEYALRYVKFLHDSREFLQHTKVLHGDFPFIKVRQDEVIEHGISQAYMKLKTIAASLNWAYFFPRKLDGKPSLFEFIVKNLRFFLQHALNATEGPKFRSKEELDELLAERGITIPKYKNDPSHIRASLLYATVGVLQLQKEFIEKGRKPKLDFLVENKRYEWNAPDIDDWGRYDDLT